MVTIAPFQQVVKYFAFLLISPYTYIHMGATFSNGQQVVQNNPQESDFGKSLDGAVSGIYNGIRSGTMNFNRFFGIPDDRMSPSTPQNSPVLGAIQNVENIPQNISQTVGNLFNATSHVNALSPLTSQNALASTNTASRVLGSQTSVFPSITPTSTSNQENIPQYLAQKQNDPGLGYNGLISDAAKSTNVPASLLKAVLAHESMQFTPKYVGGYHTDGTGRGVAGIDKKWHPEITDEQAFSPAFAVPWMAKTLAGYYKQEGNWSNALKRYNGGGNYNSTQPGYAGVPINQRTQNYSDNVLKQANNYGTNQATMSAR